VRSQVLNLMVRLQRERNLTYIFISHDLSVVEHISDSIAIMYLGRIVEKGPAARVFAHPAHPYTRALIEAIPVPDPERRHTGVPVHGEAPSAVSPPPGCPFHPRCPYAIEACRQIVPPLEPLGAANPYASRDHVAACIRKDEI
jgi:oligopeptide/dipeptide ABC transporter ATP-binding protein